MNPPSTTLVTGGSGLLGTALRALAPEFLYPSRADFDITDPDGMEACAIRLGCDQIIHAAAFTSPPKVDHDPLRALDTNVVGTANVVRLCMKLGAHLLYVSTDYVFPGDQGLRSESDPVLPVNAYAWSKLGGECAARLYDRSLIVRTTFGPGRFPYERAFVDQWTSREPVAVIAAKILELARRRVCGVVHVGGPRRTVLDYARSLDPSRTIEGLSIHDVPFKVPADTSLDCRYYDTLVGVSPLAG